MKKSERGPCFCELYLQEPHQVLAVKIRDKSCASGRRRRKVAILKDNAQRIMYSP